MATVLVPTTGDRGPLLPYSVGSVLAQTRQDLEVLIIGDGMDALTQSIASELCERDSRVRLFEFPKHQRRGEPNRHEVLMTEARGQIVAYICDRDLWLPEHLEEHAHLLNGADFAYTLRVRVTEADEIQLFPLHDLCDRDVRARVVKTQTQALVQLSVAAHTLRAYRRLPHGWRTTPENFPTDTYMWLQFLEQSWVSVASSPFPTALTFSRGYHPGWSTHRRLEILERWTNRLAEPGARRAVEREALAELWEQWRGLNRAHRRRLARRVRRAAARTAHRLRLR
jgi:glycosyltransferase involved in cell wall biosynthesis